MKKYMLLISVLALLYTLEGYADIITVGHDGWQDYDNIQDAVDNANNNDELVLSVATYYEEVDLDNFGGNNLTIRSTYPNQWNIVYATQIVSSVLPEPGACFYKLSNSSTTKIFTFKGLHLWGCNGIYSEDDNVEIHSINNLIDNMTCNGITMLNSDKLLEVTNNRIHAYNGIIHIGESNPPFEPSTIIQNSIINCSYTAVNGYSYGSWPNTQNEITINNSTITDCIRGVCGIDIDINNSIVYCDSSNLYTGNMTATYSDIKGGFPGTGNINKNPKFCMEGYYSYHLLEGSPCIDAGDPDETDADGTRLDMGCYPSTTDIKPLTGNHWNWVSFPRLEREGNDGVIAYLLLENMIPFPEMMTLMFSGEEVLIYEYGVWSNLEYEIISDNGYQLDPQEDGSYILPEPGSRLPADHTKTVYPGQRNCIGYWLPMTQHYYDALGDQLEYVTAIYAEDWYVYKINGQWYGMSIGINEEPATFEYGKGYIIVVDSQFNLEWYNVSRSEPYKKGETEFFTYEDKPNYEMIEIESIENGENIQEIGIFQGDVCVGASKVEGYPVHLMAYTDAVNRSGNLSFELVSGGRNIRKIDIVWKYNFETGQYESTTLHPFENQFSLIKLGRDGDSIQSSIFNIQLSNYPNPFNPTTTISFSVTQNAKSGSDGSSFVTLEIYNLKGQKVKTLIQGEISEGLQQVIWDGKDENNNPVSSGVYLYRLETADKVISKKMILMK